MPRRTGPSLRHVHGGAISHRERRKGTTRVQVLLPEFLREAEAAFRAALASGNPPPGCLTRLRRPGMPNVPIEGTDRPQTGTVA